ncbi:hypothetical protein, partial [Escherichia coli]|uniref:hypothetical protein n=1 Tax=Escherichia coli TaxID=562 RepID=UPI00195A56F7
ALLWGALLFAVAGVVSLVFGLLGLTQFAPMVLMATGLMQRNPARRTEQLLEVLQENLKRIDEMVANLLDISHVSVGGGIKLTG